MDQSEYSRLLETSFVSSLRWKNMAIDWTKIEAKPDKEAKVMGQVLLDFRAKVQDQTIEINNLHTENEKLVN